MTRTATMIEELETSTSTEKLRFYLVIVMCVLVILTGVVGWLWYSKTTRDKANAERAQNEATAAADFVRTLIKKDPNDYATLKKAIEDADPKVKSFPLLRSELAIARSDVISREQTATAKKENMKLLEDIKRDIEDSSKRSSIRLLLDRARMAGNSMGKEYQDEVVKLNTKLTANTLKDGIDAAKAKEASGDLPGALSAYDEAMLRFNKEFDKQGGRAEGEILELYKGLVTESDKLVERVETPEFEAQIPERDMLSVKERGMWGKSPGAEYSFPSRELEMKGVTVEGKKLTGVVSFGLTPQAPWHDVVMDLNFTLIAGHFELYLRYWPDKRWFTIKFDKDAGYEFNKPYQITIRVKGSKIELLAPEQNPQVDLLTPNTSRTGGIGFGLNPDAKVIISTCKVKVLRPRTTP